MNLNALCSQALTALLNLRTTAVVVSSDKQLSTPWNRGDSKPPSVWLAKQTLRVMKLTAILICYVFVSVSAEGVAQKIDLNIDHGSLESILKSVKNQTGLLYWIDQSVINQSDKFDIHLSHTELRSALHSILDERNLLFSISDNMIVITRAPKKILPVSDTTAPGKQDIHGKVTNEKSEPIEGVTVTVKGSKRGTNTDANGEFVLKNVSTDASLIITSVGFETREYKVNGKSEFSVIPLKPKVTKLDDVTVEVNTGYQQIPKERATGSFVQIDNELFNRRVSTDILSRIEGIVPGVFILMVDR